ncbi:MAG: leucine-rich repeat protein, partial [Bacteroidales bacterium]|nr:leucine-rich repeat protein [Bacteroidales bacterium]
VIPPYLCYRLTGLTTITIPNSVTSIGGSAFFGCSGLTSVTIGNSVTSIGDSTFRGCSGLTSVTIPNSVTYIGDYSFSGCSGLTSVSFNADSCTSAGSIYSNRAFVNCTNITSFTFGSNVRVIPPYLCEGIMGLTSVTIPNSVTSIGGRAFYNCSGLTSITIGNSVTSIGQSAFYICSGLTAVHYNGTVGQWCGTTFGDNNSNPLKYAHRLYINNAEVTSASIPNTVTEIKPYTFYGWSGLTSVTIPNSVNFIGDVAFWGCSGLTSLTIPNSVTSIGKNAFYGCSGLTSITIGNSVTSIGQYAFYGCSGLTSLTIPNSVTSIGGRAFYNCSGLTSITIGTSVTSIGAGAFSGCSGLTAVHYNGTVGQWCGTTFGDDDSNPLRYANRLYINNAEVTSASIPNTVTEIKPYTFCGWSGLTSITIPNSVSSIGQFAFSGCSGLTSVNIPNSVYIIGNSAFSGCSGLTSVNIPDSVYSIGNSAFSGCSGLTSMTFLGSMPPQQIGTNTFNGVPTDIPVYIPCGRLAYYVNQLPRFTNYIEHLYEFSAVSADESRGTVQVLTEPSCSNPNAVLNAVPANGYRFDHWSTGSTDNPYTLTVTNDTIITAYFEEITTPTYTVTVTADNPTNGSVTGGGVFEEGTTITLTATPSDGYHFDHWSTGGTDNPYTLTVTSDTTIIGYFVANGSQGIDEVVEGDIHISVSDGHINVEGVAEKEVQVYDITGRMVQNRSLPSGVYIVKIGTLAAHKVVVMR